MEWRSLRCDFARKKKAISKTPKDRLFSPSSVFSVPLWFVKKSDRPLLPLWFVKKSDRLQNLHRAIAHQDMI
ncbi:hypothetical protein [Nostoc sp.]|uniref:hypothetical protein n=1 Tax=Nostoc sp. TaxID=1180 RepID=UPI002FF5366B